MNSLPTGHAEMPLAIRHVSPTLDIIEHDINSRSCSCIPRIEAVTGGYVVVHNRMPLAEELDDRLTSLSSRALTYVIRRSKEIQKERLDDGVFE
jgi:hypothetical protein